MPQGLWSYNSRAWESDLGQNDVATHVIARFVLHSARVFSPLVV
jgi:hypothetical protein